MHTEVVSIGRLLLFDDFIGKKNSSECELIP